MEAIKHITSIFFLLLFIFNSTSGAIEETTIEEHVMQLLPVPVPVEMGRSEYRMAAEIDGGGRRRKLGPFQVCLVCRCCVMATDPSTCSNMPCCFGIDCQLPNKPFGVCAFVPKTCNCTTCAAP
ncbi:hypothetical protein L1987_03665 [Smallanthus sonchifolius]|uniref:Uncharacterized protein n=1 Tax=Smallanthus sonchifolius TaxID=185202 RepID=A0ACB9KBF1_9ASTR|nr:hypothetical protein L1987_03665 [Smallanthus sonchifolius]